MFYSLLSNLYKTNPKSTKMTYSLGPLHFDNPFEFDWALLAPVTSMMQNGINIDLDKKNLFSAEYTSRWRNEQQKLNSVAGYEVNVNSHGATGQVAQLLYGDIGLPERRYKNRVTTAEAALRSLLGLCESKVKKSSAASRVKWLRGYISIMEILKVRSIRKRLSNYINAKVDNDGHMRCTISIGGTETGRFSHSKTLWGTGCNLATVPRELRSMFIADRGKELAEFDLNRGESWVYSHLAEDPEMMAIHQQGRDFHKETACTISTAFGEAIRLEDWPALEKASPEKAYKLRFLGKKTNHATTYLEGPLKGAEEVNKEADDTGITCTSAQFKDAQRFWFRKYSRIKGWWKSTEGELSDTRTLETPFGRIRTFYGHWGNELLKEAVAYRPQGTSVDYLNLAMLNVYSHLILPDRRWGLDLLHQNHDSILVQYDREHRDEVVKAIIDHMTYEIDINNYAITIPIEAEVGPSWGELKAWEEAA